MDIILVPGLWLDASSWDEVTTRLTDAGHRVSPLTLPGLGSPASESSEVGIADWVSTVVEQMDAAPSPVALVGHSGGGNVVWGAADTRPDRVAHVVFVDTVPPPNGAGINEFEITDGVIPFPGWDFFPAEDVSDLDESTRRRTAALTRSIPARVPTDPIVLRNPARYQVPVTLLMGGLDAEGVQAELANWGPYADEFRAIRKVEIERIGSGHWPQFSQPEKLSELILRAVSG